MRLIVGAPVANRAWALPDWFRALASQTRRPDGFAFIHSGQPGDSTWQTILTEVDRHPFREVDFDLRHNPALAHVRHDDARFATLAALRNDLLHVVRDSMQADLFLSLDTDVLLNDPQTLERLEGRILADECDVAQPVTFPHDKAPATWTPGDPAGWAYNFGWLAEHPTPPRRTLVRPDPSEIVWGDTFPVDIPMACWLGNRKAMWCEYQHHQSGEDIGFAQSLRHNGVRCVADTSLYARHVWSEAHLHPESVAA